MCLQIVGRFQPRKRRLGFDDKICIGNLILKKKLNRLRLFLKGLECSRAKLTGFFTYEQLLKLLLLLCYT